MRAPVGITSVPDVLVTLGFIRTPETRCGRTRPAGILPFRFGRQTVSHTFFAAQPIAERHGISPGDVYNRLIVSPVVTHVPPVELRPRRPLAIELAVGSL